MTNLEPFDVNVCVGAWHTGEHTGPADAAELDAALDAAGVHRAVVWHRAQRECSPQEGNRLLAERFAPCDRAVLSWTLLPPQVDGLDADALFDAMDAANACVLRAFPVHHNYLLRRTVFNGVLDALAEQRIPLVLSLENGIDWPGVYALLEACPGLTCILCDTGIWNGNRFLWPLLGRFDRVYAETSCLSLSAGGLEAAVHAFGAERLLFGSGYPVRYPEAPLMDLHQANVLAVEKELIARGNLERILEESAL